MRAARFFPAPLLLTLKAGVRKRVFSSHLTLFHLFYNPICEGELQTCWRKVEAFAEEWNKALGKCSFGSAVRFRPDDGVHKSIACFLSLFFCILLHCAGNKESPICLAAGELNESFYGLSNLGWMRAKHLQQHLFEPRQAGKRPCERRRPLCFSSGGRRGAGGRISLGSSGVNQTDSCGRQTHTHTLAI